MIVRTYRSYVPAQKGLPGAESRTGLTHKSLMARLECVHVGRRGRDAYSGDGAYTLVPIDRAARDRLRPIGLR